MRFYALYTYANTQDVAYDAIYILLWSQIEINIALISASAAVLRPLFRKTFGTSNGGTNSEAFGAPNLYLRSQKSGHIELQDYSTTHRTVVAAEGDDGSNSSQEELTRESLGRHGIIKTVETRVHMT